MTERVFTRKCPYPDCNMGCYSEANHRARYACMFRNWIKKGTVGKGGKNKKKKGSETIVETPQSALIDHDKLSEFMVSLIDNTPMTAEDDRMVVETDGNTRE